MRAVSEYVWPWIASLACFVCYGYIVVRWYIQAGRKFGNIRDSLVMLWYPIGEQHRSYFHALQTLLNLPSISISDLFSICCPSLNA